MTPAVIPNNSGLERPLAAGVTTILFIPGSGTNMGGTGVLMKLGIDGYEEALLRDPGSLKIAQGDNPTRWGYGMGRILMNYGLRFRLRRGRAYAKAWDLYLAGEGDKPERELELDVFRSLYAGDTQVSTHTQYYQLVLMTITMLARDFGLPTYIDHGSFDSYLTTPLAMEFGVGAILGPREIMVPRPPLRHRRPHRGHGLGLPGAGDGGHRLQHRRPCRPPGGAHDPGRHGGPLRPP